MPIQVRMGMKPLLTARDVAELLAVTPWTVYDLARRKELSSIRIGRNCVRFEACDVERFIDQRRVPAL